MNLTDDEILKFLKGSPVLLDDICAVYPATLGQIIDEGYDEFQKYLSVLTTTKPIEQNHGDKELQAFMAQLTDFQYILLISSVDPQIHDLMKRGFKFFTHEDVIFSLDPEQIVIGPLAEKHLLTEDKFYDFQRLLRKMYFLDADGEEEIIIYDTDDAKTKQIKMDLRRSREKVRLAKARKASQSKSDLKLSDLIGSLTLNNCGLNIHNIWDITYYAFHDQLKRMGWRDQFDINQRAALAGAKIQKSQLKHWMRSISDSGKS